MLGDVFTDMENEIIIQLTKLEEMEAVFSGDSGWVGLFSSLQKMLVMVGGAYHILGKGINHVEWMEFKKEHGLDATPEDVEDMQNLEMATNSMSEILQEIASEIDQHMEDDGSIIVEI